MAVLFPLILAGWILITAAQTSIVHGSLEHLANGGDAQATAFIAGSRAATAFAQANPGYSGTITAQQLAPYMTPYTLPAGWRAGIQGGQLLFWVGSPNAGTPRDVWSLTGNDCAYAVNVNGTLQSTCGALEAAPAGVAEGSLAYVIMTP